MEVSRRRQRGTERLSEEIIADNVPNLMKDIYLHIQECQQSPSKKSKRSILRHIVRR